MNNIVLILWFVCSFMLVTGVLYYFLLSDKNLEKRLNYYLDIEEKYKNIRDNKVKAGKDKNLLRRLNEIIRKGLKAELPSEKQRETNQMLISAGVSLRSEEFVMLRLFLSVVLGGGIYLLLNNLPMLIAGIICGYQLPKVWIKSKRKKRMIKFNKALPDMINTMISALKSGFSLAQAMKTVSEECDTPIKDEIEMLLKELNYGVTMEEALGNLNKRMPSVDLELLIQATLIQRQSGGNLSNILEIIANTIRERIKLDRQVRTLTAQGRLSGRIIGALPIALGFILYLFDPVYITNFLGNTIGKIAIAVGIILAVMGFVIINKITKIEV